MTDINIDKNSDLSIYKQIVSQIAAAVEKGALKPGDRLPTERELSACIKISRGTIRKAYNELENKSIIETIKGSGSFVSINQDVLEGDRKENAVHLIDELLSRLEGLNFTIREIRAIIDLRMMERENRHEKVRIAAIDCNPEALEIFKLQISYMKNIEFRMFIIDEILGFSNPNKIFEDYDVIITTPTHYTQIIGILYPLRNRLFKVAVSPARDTIIKIATISENSRIGIIVKSNNFKNIILEHLESLCIAKKYIEYVFETDFQGIIRLLNEKDILIIPQCFAFQNENLKEGMNRFAQNGGKIIEFKYQIERGSLIYIEEQIGAVLRSRRMLQI